MEKRTPWAVTQAKETRPSGGKDQAVTRARLRADTSDDPVQANAVYRHPACAVESWDMSSSTFRKNPFARSIRFSCERENDLSVKKKNRRLRPFDRSVLKPNSGMLTNDGVRAIIPTNEATQASLHFMHAQVSCASHDGIIVYSETERLQGSCVRLMLPVKSTSSCSGHWLHCTAVLIIKYIPKLWEKTHWNNDWGIFIYWYSTGQKY